MPPFRLAAAILATGLTLPAVTACGGGSTPVQTRTPPDLTGFLRLPVATPTSCPPSVPASTSGRRSPWVGHIDVSVFVDDAASVAQVRALHGRLAGLDHVKTVYFESRAEAYAEFQRLYTCSAQISRSDLPASYRLVLDQVTRPQRDALVREIYRLPGVGSVSCDPSSPCVDVRR